MLINSQHVSNCISSSSGLFLITPAIYIFFFVWLDSPIWTWSSSIRRGFTITIRHTTVGRTPLDEWSARRRNLHLTTHNTHNRQTSMPPGGIRTRNPSKRAAVDPRLRPHGHWDRLVQYINTNLFLQSETQDMKRYEWSVGISPLILISVPDARWSASRCAYFTLGKELNRRLGGRHSLSGRFVEL
jgi:hypothetical protein